MPSDMWPPSPAQGRFDFDRPARPAEGADVLYFAILPDAASARNMVELGASLLERQRLRAALMAPERVHISLWGVSRPHVPPAHIAAAARAIGARVAWPDFEVVLTSAATFGGGALVFKCAEGAGWALKGLRDAIGQAAEELDLGPDGRSSFTPHLTFAWGRRPMDEAPLDDLIRWPARELVLVHSEQGRGRHNHLGRWPLSRGRIVWTSGSGGG